MAGTGGDEVVRRPIPPAPPPHGTFVAWHRGCRRPRCGALPYHRCRNVLVPAHFTATHPERAARPER